MVTARLMAYRGLTAPLPQIKPAGPLALPTIRPRGHTINTIESSDSEEVPAKQTFFSSLWGSDEPEIKPVHVPKNLVTASRTRESSIDLSSHSEDASNTHPVPPAAEGGGFIDWKGINFSGAESFLSRSKETGANRLGSDNTPADVPAAAAAATVPQYTCSYCGSNFRGTYAAVEEHEIVCTANPKLSSAQHSTSAAPEVVESIPEIPKSTSQLSTTGVGSGDPSSNTLTLKQLQSAISSAPVLLTTPPVGHIVQTSEAPAAAQTDDWAAPAAAQRHSEAPTAAQTDDWAAPAAQTEDWAARPKFDGWEAASKEVPISWTSDLSPSHSKEELPTRLGGFAEFSSLTKQPRDRVQRRNTTGSSGEESSSDDDRSRASTTWTDVVAEKTPRAPQPPNHGLGYQEMVCEARGVRSGSGSKNKTIGSGQPPAQEVSAFALNRGVLSAEQERQLNESRKARGCRASCNAGCGVM